MSVEQMLTYGRRVAAVALLLVSATATAGTWMRSEHESYYSARLEYETADSYWNSGWEREPMGCTAKNWKLSQSYEYGLSYYRTAFGSLELLDRQCNGNDVAGIGDLELGIRSRLDIFRNGRTWEVALILPTGYSTSGDARIGNDRYGLRLGAFGRFAGPLRNDGSESATMELGGNVYAWEGDASEQLSAYVKLSVPVAMRLRLFAALEGDYALNDRRGDFTTTINPPVQYGYDKLSGRLGLSTKLDRHWTLTVEGTTVILGRNTSDANSLIVGISRNFGE